MKKYTFLSLTLIILSLLIFPAVAKADTDSNVVFTLDNLVSKVTVSFESDSYENFYTKYTAKSPAVLRLDKPSNLAYIDVYKVDTAEMINPNQYLYGSAERTPLKWDDITYLVTLYNDELEEIGTIEVKDHPSVRNYEIISGYIALTEPGLYLVSSTAWAAASDIYLVEILDSRGNPAKGADRVSYRIIGLDNFKVQKRYTPGTFNDVSDSDWYSKAVASCYELGLIEGKGGSKFDPQGSISVAEALTIAARVNKIYYGEGPEIEQTGSNWYDGAVYYAISRRIIYGDEFRVLTRPASRAELAYIFANALPDSEYKQKNNISRLPDVNSETNYSHEIFKLYNAGILTGQDRNLTFNPDANISRAEVATIVTRLVRPDNRVTF
ncbi:MAG TPA: S-layer homology domain-containing protein [Tepidanaerobacteraceae bacterium]|nr:S-layer homology domain-containing protein [Tepidanaerobacteraceae bacterium]